MIPMTSASLAAVFAGGQIANGADAADDADFLDALLAVLPPDTSEAGLEATSWLREHDAALAGLVPQPLPADDVPPQVAVAVGPAALLGLIANSQQPLSIEDGDFPATLEAGEVADLMDTLRKGGTSDGVDLLAELGDGALGGLRKLQPELPIDELWSKAEVDELRSKVAVEMPAVTSEQPLKQLSQLLAVDGPEAQADMPLPVPVRHPEFGQAVGERLVWMMQNDMQEARIRLDPPHLGPLEISVAVKDDRAEVVIHAAHALTRDALEAEAPRLRGMLGDNGFAAVDVNVARDRGGQSGDARHGNGQMQRAVNPDGIGVGAGDETAAPRTMLGLIDHYA